MSFKLLNQEDLERAIGPELLQRIKLLLPFFENTEIDDVKLYSKKTLIRLLEAFGTHNLFKNKQIFNTYLDRIPRDKLLELCSELGVSDEWSTYNDCVSKLGKLGWSNEAYCKKFVKFMDLSEKLVPHGAPHKELDILIERPRRPFKQLIDYQYITKLSCDEILENPRSRLVLQMPTGAGKTRTAMELICDHINKNKFPIRVIWLAHSTELCEQAFECMRETWEHLGQSDLHIKKYYGSQKSPLSGNTNEFVVASFQSLYALLKSNSESEVFVRPVSLLVVDEAHKVLAPTYNEITRRLIFENTKVLGLTATPGRGMDDEFGNEKLAEFFFNSIVRLQVPGDVGAIEYLRNRGILAFVERRELLSTTNYELTSEELAQLSAQLDYPVSLLNKIGSDDFRNIEIIRTIRDLQSEYNSILFFACSVEHSKFICSALNFLGIKSCHVDGSTVAEEREQLVRDFRSGKFSVLSNYGVLATGFDAPKVNVVFISRPTKSVVLYSQMIGRGLRGPRVGGTERCVVYDVVDNIDGLPSNDEIFDFFEEYWSC